MWQMFGLLIRGIVWGIMGRQERPAKRFVWFHPALFSGQRNIANGFVENVPQYQLVRFIAGLSLAGELGAGITLVSELVSKERRGVAMIPLWPAFGLTGAVVAFIIKENFNWRVCYFHRRWIRTGFYYCYGYPF